VNKHAKQILDSILEELTAADKSREAIEAKAVFCLLNYCPPDHHTLERESTAPRE
jgi:hypothetical protein